MVPEPRTGDERAAFLGQGEADAEEVRDVVTEGVQIMSEALADALVESAEPLGDQLLLRAAPGIDGLAGQLHQAAPALGLPLSARPVGGVLLPHVAPGGGDLGGQRRGGLPRARVDLVEDVPRLGADEVAGLRAVLVEGAQMGAQCAHVLVPARGIEVGDRAGHQYLVEETGRELPGAVSERAQQVGVAVLGEIAGERRGQVVHAATHPFAGGAHEHRDRLAQGLGHDIPGERHRLGQIGRIQLIGLVQHDERTHRRLADQAQQLLFGGRDGRVGSEDDDGRVHGAQGGHGLVGVLGVHGTGARRVDQFHTAGQQWRVQAQHHLGDTVPVAGIGRLGDELRECRGLVLLDMAIAETDGHPRGRALAHGSGQSGHRDHAGRQDVASKQRVEQGALAAFGLAGDQDPETVLMQLVVQRVQRAAVVLAADARFRKHVQLVLDPGELATRGHMGLPTVSAGTVGGAMPRLAVGPSTVWYSTVALMAAAFRTYRRSRPGRLRKPGRRPPGRAAAATAR